MKKCRCKEEITKVIEQQILNDVERGVYDADYAGAFIVGFNKELEKFVEQYSPCVALVFEGEEIEDEEFGMAHIETGYGEYEWKMVYMFARGDEVRLTIC